VESRAANLCTAGQNKKKKAAGRSQIGNRERGLAVGPITSSRGMDEWTFADRLANFLDEAKAGESEREKKSKADEKKQLALRWERIGMETNGCVPTESSSIWRTSGTGAVPAR